MLLKCLGTNDLLWHIFFLILLLQLPIYNCFSSVAAMITYMTSFWRVNRLVYCKTLFSDSGQSIYLALSHFICKTADLRTAAQSITSNNLCWQRVTYSCRFTSKTFLRQSDYKPTDLPSPYARIEEYIAPAFDEFNILQLNQSLDHYSEWII